MTSQQPLLPEENISRSLNWRRLILSLACPWLLFASANLAANIYLENFPENSGYWVIKKKWEMLLNLKQPVDWLVLGDSSCNQGVVPDIIESQLGGKALNLCTIGDTLVLNDAWMISQYIKEYGPPKNVVIVHVYDVWQREINWNVTSQTPLEWGYWERLEPQIPLNPENTKKVFLNKYVPLYSQNQSLKKILSHPDQWFNSKEVTLSEKGFMAIDEADSWNVEEDAARHIKDTSNKSFTVSNTNQKSLETILQLAEKYDFNVYLTNSPIYQKLYSNPEFKTYYHQVQQQLQEFSDRSDKIHYIMPEPMTFSKEEMENADHLIQSAAETYTNKLVVEIINN